jgi:bifunctional oligoribonuclease and PAP phosphatase NrnA
MTFFPELAEGFRGLLDTVDGRRVAVVGHARPDGDCIGSQVALCRVLRSRGVEAVCVNADPAPRRLRFLLGDTPFLLGAEFAPAAAPHAGWCAVHVDCADGSRSGPRLAQVFPRPLASIDHHISNDRFAERNLVDGNAAATAEIIAGLLLDAGLGFDATAAQGLYAGIVTDTGQFRFPSTTRRVFEITGHLIDRGADPATASAELYEQESFAKLELLGRFLASFQLECSGRVCAGFLRLADFSETGATGEDTEGLVDFARAIEGVEVGLLLEERPNGTKASLRSKDPAMRVDQIAAAFGGGGHACAAGLNVSGAPAVLYPALIAAVAAQLARVEAARAVS